MSWLGKLREVEQQRKAQREASLRPLVVDYPDRIPGWLDCGQTFTAVFPPGLEPDPAVVAAIRQFCPDYVPLWLRWAFRAPWDDAAPRTEVFGRHVIARLVASPSVVKHEFPGVPLTVANYLEQILMGPPPDTPGASDLPGYFIPLDWGVVGRLREVYDRFKEQSGKERARTLVRTPLEHRKERAVKRALARTLAEQDIRGWQQKRLDQLSEVDIKNYSLYGLPKQLPKPFIHLAGDK